MRTKHQNLAWIALTLAFGFACDQESTDARKSDASDLIPCAGAVGLLCPEGLECRDDGADDCDPAQGDSDCPGHCQPDDPVSCGGVAGFDCPGGQPCVDDPSDSCDPDAGGADCLGVCMTPPIAHCGGPEGFECAPGQVCIDDPNDECNPTNGGEDCIGLCEDLQILSSALD
ncbi:hypothetical protein OV203_28575 [Nannocystis sp. ILAH1]|uniref:hypothetical protein n=1 Tax=unclassified Nannocystis TaxID=2627009 RepID=UPI002270EEBA|nr:MULTISPECIES: hypothetical protein [unclassified Nannocystis]MCY0991134.1 hypothetical protein [Nannocystis sp. ILAH1]MCY1064648.1 hypothetical protein [Nannocystis sp. RBIL2]